MQGLNRPALQSSLRDAASWFRHWIIPTTHRLHYALTYQRGWVDDRASPIRDLGTGYDLAVLQHHLGSREFDAAIGATLAHYQPMLVHHPGAWHGDEVDAVPPAGSGVEAGPWCHLGAGRGGLGEPSTVAHSAMLLLALASWEGHPKPAQRRRLMAELAAGLLRQQRGDGSFAVHFDPPGLPDSGWQLYGGEAAYALAAAGAALDDARLLGAAERALEAYRRRQGEVEAEERAFFANWQCQAGAAVHRQLPPGRERRQLAAYMHGLQGGIIGSGYYQDVREAPKQQATVEVACALEGLADCLAVSLADGAAAGAAGEGAAAEEERGRQRLYLRCADVAVAFLLEAQVIAGPGVPAAAVGGWGHSQAPGSGQRVDVTGHVACAFVKLLGLEGVEGGGGA